MRLLRFLGIVLVVAVGAGSLALSGGKEIRVPQDYKTIQEAINAASEGDTILVDVGTYKETIEIPKGLTLVGADRDKTIISGSDLPVVTISSAALVTVRNVTITNGRDGVLVERGAQALLRQARIAQNKRHGVLVLGQAQLLGNLIHNNGNCGVNAFPGAQVQGSGNIIRDNGGGDLCGDVPAQLKAEGGPPYPVVRLSPSEWTNRNQFTLDWENPDYPARITAAWYKVGGAPTSSEDGRRTTEKPLQLQSPSEGRQAVYLWLEDELGQKDHRNASQASMLLDQTPPTIIAAVNPQPNAQGWNNTDVTVRFSCQDALSGVASCTPTDPIQVTQEGQGQTIQAQAVDKAGNRAERTVTVNLDKTKPQLTLGEPQGTLGSEGWYRTDVVVPYTATDNLAGFSGGQRQLQGSARSSGEGSAVRVRVRVEDLAGNATEAEAGPFKVDQTPPTISAAVNPQPNAQGWNNTDVTVRFQCEDALSGLVSCTPQEERVTSEGERRIEGRAEDRAGNVRTTSVTVRLDKTPPRVSCQPPDTTRWYREDVSVPCTASDSLSGLANSADASFTLIARGEGRAVSTGTRTVADRAGNSVTAGPYTFQIDKTPPTITAEPERSPDSNGWYNREVTVRFQCSDALSGLVSCTPQEERVTSEGERRIEGRAEDRAGNVRTTSVTVRLDKTPPTGSLTINDGAASTYSTTVTLRITANDNLSGVAEMRFSNDGRTWSDWESFSSTKLWNVVPPTGSPLLIGSTVTVYAQLKDRAGNVSRAFSAAIQLKVTVLPNPSLLSLQFSDDRTLTLATYRQSDRKLEISQWDVSNGQSRILSVVSMPDEVAEVISHPYSGRSISPDWRLLAVHDWVEPTVYVVDVATGRVLRTLERDKPVIVVVFSPDSRTLAVGYQEAKVGDTTGQVGIHLYDTRTWQLRLAIKGDYIRSDITIAARFSESLTFSPDGSLIAAAVTSCQGYVGLWDTVSGQLLRCFLPGDTYAIGGLAFTKDGRLIAAVNWRSKIWIWELATGRVLRKLDCNSAAILGGGFAAFSPDGSVLAVSCYALLDLGEGGTTVMFQLWDVATGQLLISMPAWWVGRPTFSPSGQLLTLPIRGYGILLWNTNDLIRR
jgi:WD40 repeat protein